MEANEELPQAIVEPEVKNKKKRKRNKPEGKDTALYREYGKRKDINFFRSLDLKYKFILDELARVKMKDEAEKIINTHVETGGLSGEDEAHVVFLRFKQMKKRMAKAEQLRNIINFDGTLEEVKSMVNDLVKRKKILPNQAGEVVTKWRAREKRRITRQKEKMTNTACLRCRLKGHRIADCPQRESEEEKSDICFKCGSLEHNIYSCPKKNIRGFPFATCFLCNGEGHLARDCESNKNGIYPDGGSCNVCGSQKHLKKDCPELEMQKKGVVEKRVVAQTMDSMTNMDDDYQYSEPKVDKPVTKKKKAKVVNF